MRSSAKRDLFSQLQTVFTEQGLRGFRRYKSSFSRPQYLYQE